MTQNNTRKEPTFGEATANRTEKTVEKNVNVAPSLHTTQNPGHTFTPVLKRSEEATTSSTMATESSASEKSKGFNFSSAADKTDKKVESEKNETEQPKSVAQETAKAALNTAERVVPTVTLNQGNDVKEVEEMKKTGFSSKGKRLGLVAALAVILGGVFFWLKPSTPETVEELQQQQGGSLPIEFRPVDEAEAQKAEAEAKAQAELQAQQALQQQTDAQTQAQRDALAELQARSQAAQQANQVGQTTQQPQIQFQPPVSVPANGTQTVEQQAGEAGQPAQTVESGTLSVPAATANTVEATASIVHQEEKKVAPQPARKVEKARQATAKPKVKAITAAEFNARKAKNEQMDKLVQSVSEGKKVAKTTATQTASAKTSASSSAVASKTMIVPKGTSLMQVFRDNNLNISDVNAMSKVNKAASSLKTNEKVTVRLDKNNRVVEMSIGSGGKYIRQADGSYTFK